MVEEAAGGTAEAAGACEPDGVGEGGVRVACGVWYWDEDGWAEERRGKGGWSWEEAAFAVCVWGDWDADGEEWRAAAVGAGC